MTSFLVVWDRDRERRSRCLEAAEPALRLVDGLEKRVVRSGPAAALWLGRPGAPAQSAAPPGADAPGAAVIWGHAFERGARTPVQADELLDHRDESGDRPPARCFDGFHGWCAWREGAGLSAGADPLGLFPLYWTAPGPGLLVAASHPGALRAHEAVSSTLDRTGLAGLLLTNGLVGGRSLLEGVRRLPPGHALRLDAGGEPEEVPLYRPRAVEDRSDWTRERLRASVDAALERAVHRHLAPHDSSGVLLSGGLDSRLFAGYARETGSPTTAITMGRGRDFEFRCAARVAETLELAHEGREHGPAEIVEGARLEARRMLLSNGFSAPHGWSLPLGADDPPPALVTGHLSDAVLSASHLGPAKTPEGGGRLSAEALIRSLNRWAVPMDVLRGTARPGFLEECVEPLWRRLAALVVPEAASPERQLWLAYLRSRQRYHVGAAPWRTSFAAWPVSPVDDRRVLDTVASTPVAALEDRVLQTELLEERFPELASLPLDRNSHDRIPPAPGPADHLKSALRQWGRRLPGAWRLRQLREDRRYYYRIYDLASPGWRRIRERAEPARERLDEWFDTDALTRRYLPPPGETAETADGIIDAAGRKLLLGLMLWLR